MAGSLIIENPAGIEKPIKRTHAQTLKALSPISANGLVVAPALSRAVGVDRILGRGATAVFMTRIPFPPGSVLAPLTTERPDTAEHINKCESIAHGVRPALAKANLGTESSEGVNLLDIKIAKEGGAVEVVDPRGECHLDTRAASRLGKVKPKLASAVLANSLLRSGSSLYDKVTKKKVASLDWRTVMSRCWPDALQDPSSRA